MTRRTSAQLTLRCDSTIAYLKISNSLKLSCLLPATSNSPKNKSVKPYPSSPRATNSLNPINNPISMADLQAKLCSEEPRFDRLLTPMRNPWAKFVAKHPLPTKKAGQRKLT